MLQRKIDLTSNEIARFEKNVPYATGTLKEFRQQQVENKRFMGYLVYSERRTRELHEMLTSECKGNVQLFREIQGLEARVKFLTDYINSLNISSTQPVQGEQ